MENKIWSLLLIEKFYGIHISFNQQAIYFVEMKNDARFVQQINIVWLTIVSLANPQERS